eukprot:299462-Rhodomonas_salina.1
MENGEDALSDESEMEEDGLGMRRRKGAEEEEVDEAFERGSEEEEEEGRGRETRSSKRVKQANGAGKGALGKGAL